MPTIRLIRLVITYLLLTVGIALSVTAQTAKIDSLLKLERQLPDDTTKANVLNNLTYEFYLSDIQKYEIYSKKALELNKKLGYKRGIALATNLHAIGFAKEGEYQKAIEQNLESLNISKEIGYKEGMFIASKDLGIYYKLMEDYEQSIYHLRKSLEYHKENQMVSYTYKMLAKIHQKLGNTKEAEKYLNLSIKAAKESNSPKILSDLYLTMGGVTRDEGRQEEAIRMYNKSLEYAISENDSLHQALAKQGIALVLYDQKKFNESLNMLLKAIPLLKNSFGFEQFHLLLTLGEIYNRLNQFEKAIESAENIVQLIATQELNYRTYYPYQVLADAYAGLGQFEKAFEIKSAQLNVQDSLNKINISETIAKLETRYQLKEKQAENEQLKHQSGAQQHELLLTKNIIRQQRIITYGTIAGLFITLALLTYVYSLIKKLKITNQQLTNQSDELRIAKDKAESAAKAKSEFLSVMSHEIRTPMNAVIGMTHLLMDEEPRNDQMEYLDTLQFSGTNLIALINDILDFSKIEAGKLTLEQADLDLESLVKSITASTAIKGNDKGIEVKYSYDPALADMYIGDSVRLGQVLTNLMGNAVKFTEAGYVELQVAPAVEGKLRFSVKDTGIGIPKDKQKQIFEAFSQAADDTTRKFGGTGLGLSISRRLVELMGGELQIESEPGEGSVFFFEIELPKSDTPKKTQSEKAESGKLAFGSLAGIRVLIAEDNKINQMVVRKFLEKWDLDITIVNNGQEAVEAWENQQFDLILMDVNMPVLNGTRATGVIRERELESQKHIPILAFTASVVEDEIKAIYEAGMDDWVGKPFEPSVLYQKIRKYSKASDIQSLA